MVNSQRYFPPKQLILYRKIPVIVLPPVISPTDISPYIFILFFLFFSFFSFFSLRGGIFLVQKKNSELVNVPPGCTIRVHPLDVSFNKLFKDVVRQQFEEHIEQNLQRYTEGKISASEKRVLVTKRVGIAWTKVGSNRDMVVRSFTKCGISLSLDGYDNGEINIETIEEDEWPTSNEITEFELDSESEIEDD